MPRKRSSPQADPPPAADSHSAPTTPDTAEDRRLAEDSARTQNWKRWGPYLAERQWGTVREDYSADNDSWTYFPHSQARSRAYRWGEDGLLGICDRQCRLCFGVALWNGRDSMLKERLFGLTGPEGNHGEDVKECYYYLDSTPTHSYMRALYKYPQAAFPYDELVAENLRRGRFDREYELEDTGVFDDGRYFDVFAEYAKGAPDDILIQITVANRGDQRASIHVLPTLWFRNTWAWERKGDGYWSKPSITRTGAQTAHVSHESLGQYTFAASPLAGHSDPTLLFTENETNVQRLFDVENGGRHVKDAFHDYVVEGRSEAVSLDGGTKAALHYQLSLEAGESVTLQLRLCENPVASATRPALFGDGFREVMAARRDEADEFFRTHLPPTLGDQERLIARQGYAGLLWSKQFYHYVVADWLEGDPAGPPPPHERYTGRNREWGHLFNRDIILMPDKWEYPWYATWDLAFHAVAAGRIDPELAKEQLLLPLREWYMHPNGQLPAYEFALDDVSPPVHAWACWRLYKMTGTRGHRDRRFLARAFHKLLINFTWWVNRKDPEGNNLFAGGFLGLDNIGVFDRSKPLPTGGYLEQADGTAWMAFYCATMLSMALELASEEPAYEDVASKFFEHFVAISDAMNSLGGSGLWVDDDGFYYDQLRVNGERIPLRVRSMVGIVPLFACEVLSDDVLDRLPGFSKRMRWFIENRRDLARTISYLDPREDNGGHRLLAIPTRERLERVLHYLLDENEFLSPHGIRSLSRVHKEHPFVLNVQGHDYRVYYDEAESRGRLFGGNSNWRGPVWFPLNYLLIESLERYHHFYGESLRVEFPTGSGRKMNLYEVAQELSSRLVSLFLPDEDGRRPCHGADRRYADDPHWRDLVLFYECFCGDSGRGVGATHQTGWTALVVRALEDRAHARTAAPGRPPRRESIASFVIPSFAR